MFVWSQIALRVSGINLPSVFCHNSVTVTIAQYFYFDKWNVWLANFDNLIDKGKDW